MRRHNFPHTLPIESLQAELMMQIVLFVTQKNNCGASCLSKDHGVEGQLTPDNRINGRRNKGDWVCEVWGTIQHYVTNAHSLRYAEFSHVQSLTHSLFYFSGSPSLSNSPSLFLFPAVLFSNYLFLSSCVSHFSIYVALLAFFLFLVLRGRTVYNARDYLIMLVNKQLCFINVRSLLMLIFFYHQMDVIQC